MRLAVSIVGLLAFTFFIAAIPISISMNNGNIAFSFETMINLSMEYISGLWNGDSFSYNEGKDRAYNIIQDMPSYFLTSLQYLLIAGILAVLIGLYISYWYSKTKKEWIKDIIGFLGTIPDFILIIGLQMGVVFIYQSTGLHIARIASRSADENAYLLPLITLILLPTIFLIRTLSEKTYDVMTEDYILHAKAKGLGKRSIYIHHVVRNILPYLKADLHKVLAIMMSNLFIVEHLFNIRGLTAILFGGTTYQYNLTVNTLISLVFLYLVIYWSIRLLILILERVFAYD